MLSNKHFHGWMTKLNGLALSLIGVIQRLPFVLVAIFLRRIELGKYSRGEGSCVGLTASRTRSASGPYFSARFGVSKGPRSRS